MGTCDVGMFFISLIFLIIYIVWVFAISYTCSLLKDIFICIIALTILALFSLSDPTDIWNPIFIIFIVVVTLLSVLHDVYHGKHLCKD